MSLRLDGTSLSIAGLNAIARGGESVELDPAGVARNRAGFEASLASTGRVYGLSTQVGALRGLPVEAGAAAEHQRRLLRSHAGGSGALVAPEIARATLAVRLNQLLTGGAGVQPALLATFAEWLNRGEAPLFRVGGSLGTGDLTALAEIGLAAIGEPLREGPLSAAPLGPRDGLMLISSNAHAIGESALVCADLATLLGAAEVCAALSFEALGADPAPLDERVQAARPHRGQLVCAQRLRELLSGYRFEKGPHVQDSFAFRCLPQVLGALCTALERLSQIVAIEMNCAAENALHIGGEFLPSGNFHAGELALGLDHVRNALAQATSLTAARVTDLLTRGPGHAFLAGEPGLDSGLLILEYTARAAAGESEHRAAPATRSAIVGGGLENHASFAALAARETSASIQLFATAVACEWAAAFQALRLGKIAPLSAGGRTALAAGREAFSEGVADRPLVEELDAARLLLLRGRLG